MARIDELRLLTKVARMYHERGLRQAAIADQLNLSQATISRLLKRAEEERLVRTTVSVPLGAFPELEEKLQAIYKLKDVIIVDSVTDDDQILRDIGAAAAFYVETTVKRGEVVGISSWSATLLAMVDAMHPLPKSVEANVVQILGGIGDPAAEAHAAHLSRRLAALMHGKAIFLPAPGVAGTAETRRVYLDDPFVREAMALFESVSLALVGIGSVEPSRLLASSGNVFSPAELEQFKAQGAVGDVCLRFFDSAGLPVVTPHNDRVIGMSLEQLSQVRRTVGIAGGERKLAAIRGALEGSLINVLITDRHTADKLIPRAGSGVVLPEPAGSETKKHIH
ncbi:MAG: sugar-binding transcriptional regulator [Acidobacteriota bacterium]|nr:MAG: sugar-binding transcriptional regulator [Acidobacteriota bacterium]